jgi:hypothetical protein
MLSELHTLAISFHMVKEGHLALKKREDCFTAHFRQGLRRTSGKGKGKSEVSS